MKSYKTEIIIKITDNQTGETVCDVIDEGIIYGSKQSLQDELKDAADFLRAINKKESK